MTAPQVDAHHHLLYPQERTYPWLQHEPYRALERRFGVDELLAATAGTGVEQTVAIETARTAEEIERLLREAAERPSLAGVVGWVDLTDAGVGEELARLREQPGGERLVGLRHPVHDEPDAEWLARADVREGLRAAARAGLPFDLLVRARELPAAIDLADALPQLRLVVDHVAKPTVGAADAPVDDEWERLLRELARRPQVSCKLSGLVTEMRDGLPWSPEALAPYMERVLEWFGPERLMYGSDWPVCTLVASYAEVHELARAFVERRLSPAERERVMGGAARAFYGLAAPARRRAKDPA